MALPRFLVCSLLIQDGKVTYFGAYSVDQTGCEAS
jgi:hypothetical protein